VWGGELLASGRKFDTDVKNEAVERTSKLAKENWWKNVRSKFLERRLEAFDTSLVFGPCSNQNWTPFVAPNGRLTYISTVIFWVCLPKVGMDRGCIDDGVCIIRAFQGICSTM
jgi:hypothetical protein